MIWFFIQQDREKYLPVSNIHDKSGFSNVEDKSMPTLYEGMCIFKSAVDVSGRSV